MGDERLRDAARPHGIVAQGCRGCALLGVCGGIEPEGALFGCFDRYCCGGKAECDEVCPYNATFLDRMAEVGGLRFDDVASLKQSALDLPRYVPLVHHGYSHRKPLELPIAALDSYQVFRLKGGRYGCVAGDGAQLRKEFGLSPSTKIILRGTAKDRPLEQFWSYRRRDAAAYEIQRLQVSLAIAPNFSHFLDVPRPDNLFNRKRQLICVREMDEAGVLIVPHLSAVSPGDWRFWRSYLEQNETVRFVAIEFQTGNKQPAQGRNVIAQLAALQEAVVRDLHPIAVGGTQFVRDFAARFKGFTLIDSCPFMKAVKRRKFDRHDQDRRWADTYTLNGQGIDAIFLRNLEGHTAWIEEQCSNRMN
jgi:hypothetical protein